PASDSFSIAGALSLSGWCRYDGKATEFPRIISRACPAGETPGYGWGLCLDKSEPQHFSFYLTHPDGTGLTLTGQTKIQPSQWYHVAGVFDPAGPKLLLYVNGVKEGEMAAKAAELNVRRMPLRIGDDAGTNSRLKGAIDEVRVYNRVLTEAEIQSLATSRK
ncbi:MAG TPA: LamG domain-containing protein, partial [Planctomycetota bacterium]|nr:LamG domain-containing protein [Planctomycetota bacterium]